jgi:hypothetical protein
MAWLARGVCGVFMLLLVGTPGLLRAQLTEDAELPELPGYDDGPRNVTGENDPQATEENDRQRAHAQKMQEERKVVLAEVLKELEDFKSRAAEYRKLAAATQLKRDELQQAHTAALRSVATKLGEALDGKQVTIDFVTAQVAAHEAELALLAAADERLAACRRYEEELIGASATTAGRTRCRVQLSSPICSRSM